jgi:UDP-perosamine 4-acetyltransferase
MADASVVVVGAGGHARVVVEALLPRAAAGHLSPEPAADPRLGAYLGGDDAIPVLAGGGYAFALGLGFVDAAGATRRARLLDLLADAELVTVVHAAATVSPTASVGAGTFVAAAAVLGTEVQVGRATIVNTGALIDHDCVIGDNVHIAPGAVLSGGVSVGANTLIGVGAAVIQGITIGSGVIVGAGAVVTADLPDGITAIGVPARITT